MRIGPSASPTCVMRRSSRSLKKRRSAGRSAQKSPSTGSPASACCHASRGSGTACRANTVCTKPEQSAPHGVTPPHW